MNFNANKKLYSIDLLGETFVITSYTVSINRPKKYLHLLSGESTVRFIGYEKYALKLNGYFTSDAGVSPDTLYSHLNSMIPVNISFGGVSYISSTLCGYKYSEDTAKGDSINCELEFIAEGAVG